MQKLYRERLYKEEIILHREKLYEERLYKGRITLHGEELHREKLYYINRKLYNGGITTIQKKENYNFIIFK